MKYSDKVLEFATKAHEGQKRKYGQNVPYITHPIAVADIAVRMHLENQRYDDGDKNEAVLEIIRSIAYLHDTKEDSGITDNQLINLFIDAHVPKFQGETILLGVNLLTKNEINFDLIEYLNNIKLNIFAKTVKLADLEHNMSDLRDIKKLEKYKLIKYYLEH
jgi:(p)ppGpp synthase/HD superfamily hydrolase